MICILGASGNTGGAAAAFLLKSETFAKEVFAPAYAMCMQKVDRHVTSS